jgi:hypothetical protein
MLKISVVEGRKQRRLVAEGRLVAPWLDELKAACETAKSGLDAQAATAEAQAAEALHVGTRITVAAEAADAYMHKADEKEGAMAQIFTFVREWSKWYCVLRHHKGFGRLDSLRYGHWLACG